VAEPDYSKPELELLVCPRCGNGLLATANELGCSTCQSSYAVSEEGIPLLFWPTESALPQGDVTEVVKAFYEQNPFPNYDDLDSRESLARKASRGVFARLLTEQIPANSVVLEVGCGTGQLSNFLGMRWDRKMYGADICLNSLRLAKGFRDRYSIRNTTFVQMNLFRPVFAPESFDIVISNGVLHHTADTYAAFRSISRLVKPGGYILIGLYNVIGRLPTDFRRFLIRNLGDGARLLDSHLRNKTYNEARKRAWFMDQYKHPHERKHSFSEVVQWYEANGFEFVSSIPRIDGAAVSDHDALFEPQNKGTAFSRFSTELKMLMAGGADGALFIVIGRKRAT